ncbi:MAG: UvrB/UvrC motif-containing protein [Planctomycetaceae bacterium]
MKKCRRCNKPATLHITEIKEGEARALHLCETCAQEYLSTVDAGSSPDEDIDPLALPLAKDNTEEEDLVCPKCQMSFSKFRSKGRLGCPHDYEVFRERLLPLLESIHGETQHLGKCPQHRPEISLRQHELVRLKTELKSAIDREDYEEAARLRDAILVVETPATPQQSEAGDDDTALFDHGDSTDE